jgi:hypothetical protein
MCRYVERREFTLDKKLSEEKILQTYDLFGLNRPKKIVWVKDIFDVNFSLNARSAWNAGGARNTWNIFNFRNTWNGWSAWITRSARSARRIWNTLNAWGAWDNENIKDAWSIRSARSARSAWNAWNAVSVWSVWHSSDYRSRRSAWSAKTAWEYSSACVVGAKSVVDNSFSWIALDSDFSWYIFLFEYYLNPRRNKLPNGNDRVYLKYSELLLEALEAGLGYRVEWQNTLYLAPIPTFRLNKDTPPQYHSDQLPAIEWENGARSYYLDGVNLPKELWRKIISKEMTLSEIMKIEISDQRTVALKYNPQAIIKEKAQLIHKDDRNNELYLIENSEINKLTEFPKMYFLKMKCPTGRIFIEGVEPTFAERHPNATECQAELCGLILSEYTSLLLES